MIVPDWVLPLGRGVLLLLAVYHLVSGALALLAPSRARAFVRALYAAELQSTPQLDYLVTMIGAQALAIGALATLAAISPLEHRSVIGALALLQLLRAGARIARRRALHTSLGVPPSRNALAAALLVAEALLLAILYAGISGRSGVGTAV